MSHLIAVNIHIDGYWPTEYELNKRNLVLEELEKRNTGHCLSTGSGHRGMSFAYEVENEMVAKTQIDSVLTKHFPRHTYSVHSVRNDNKFQTRPLQGDKCPQLKKTSQHQNRPQLNQGLGM